MIFFKLLTVIGSNFSECRLIKKDGDRFVRWHSYAFCQGLSGAEASALGHTPPVAILLPDQRGQRVSVIGPPNLAQLGVAKQELLMLIPGYRLSCS